MARLHDDPAIKSAMAAMAGQVAAGTLTPDAAAAEMLDRLKG